MHIFWFCILSYYIFFGFLASREEVITSTTTIPITREEIPAEPTPPEVLTQPIEEREPVVEDEPVVEEVQGVEEPEPADDPQLETCETDPGTVNKTTTNVVN
jgi:hypothetical protein